MSESVEEGKVGQRMMNVGVGSDIALTSEKSKKGIDGLSVADRSPRNDI